MHMYTCVLPWLGAVARACRMRPPTAPMHAQPKHRRIRRFEVLWGVMWQSLHFRK